MSIGSELLRKQRIALGKSERGMRTRARKAVKEERDKFIRVYKVTRLAGPKTPPWPQKGNFNKSGRVSRISGKLARSVKKVGRGGVNVTKAGTLSIDAGVAYGKGVIYAAVHEFGATIRAKRAPFLVFAVISGGKEKLVRVKKVKIPARAGFRVEVGKFFASLRIRLRAEMQKLRAGVA